MTQQANRAGRPWQRKDGRWATRAYVDGKPRTVYGSTEDEVLAKQHEVETGQAPPPPSPYLDADRRNARPPKPVRVTLDLDRETYAALNQWLGLAAAEVGEPVSKAKALRAMIRAVSLDKSIGLVVVDLLRRDNS